MWGVNIQPPFCPLGPWVRAGMLGWLIILALVCVRTSAQRLLRAARSGALGGSWTLGFELTAGVGAGGVATYNSARVAVLALSQTPRAQHSHSCSLPWASAFPPRRLQEYCGVVWAHRVCARCPPQHGTAHPARCSKLCACVGEMHISFGFMV